MKSSDCILGLVLVLVASAPIWAEEIVNPDGTKQSSQTVDDLVKAQNKQEAYDAGKRTSSDATRDPRLISKANEAKFPEEDKKKRLKELERSKMTVEDKEREARMLDKKTAAEKNVNPQLKERHSFPNRYGP